MTELKPCPFCGSETIKAEINFLVEEVRIYCANPDEPCLAEMRFSFEDAEIIRGRIDFDHAQKLIAEMIGLWNRRANDERTETNQTFS